MQEEKKEVLVELNPNTDGSPSRVHAIVDASAVYGVTEEWVVEGQVSPKDYLFTGSYEECWKYVADNRPADNRPADYQQHNSEPYAESKPFDSESYVESEPF